MLLYVTIVYSSTKEVVKSLEQHFCQSKIHHMLYLIFNVFLLTHTYSELNLAQNRFYSRDDLSSVSNLI